MHIYIFRCQWLLFSYVFGAIVVQFFLVLSELLNKKYTHVEICDLTRLIERQEGTHGFYNSVLLHQVVEVL